MNFANTKGFSFIVILDMTPIQAEYFIIVEKHVSFYSSVDFRIRHCVYIRLVNYIRVL